MPDVLGGSDGSAGIVRGGLHVDVAEGRTLEDLSVRHAIEGDAAGQPPNLQSPTGRDKADRWPRCSRAPPVDFQGEALLLLARGEFLR